MEKLPLETEPGGAVGAVAEDRELDRGEVHADLVRAAGLEPHAQERVLGELLLHFEVRDGVARRRRVERVSRRIVSVTADRRLDPAAARSRVPTDEREVLALQCPPADEVLEPA